LAFAVAALAGVLLGYAFWTRSKPHAPEAADTSRQSAPVAATTEAPAKPPNPAPVQATPAAVASAPRATPNVVERAAAPPPQEPKADAPPSQPPVTQPAVREKVFFVSIKAKEDSWVSIVADGKSVMQRVLPADKHKKIKAAKTLVLRTGNAGGIEVSFNGRSLGALGNENEPRTLTFNATGLVQ
jgi:cytoskeleton protein RodZ